MKSNNAKPTVSNAYFAETQPFIYKRLMPAMLIIMVSLFLAALTAFYFTYTAPREKIPPTAYWILWANTFSMFVTSIVTGYGAYQLKKGNIHQAINILLISGLAFIISQFTANGGMGETSIVMYPVLIMIAGFFSNISTMRGVTNAFSLSLVALYIAGLAGIQPPDISEFDPKEIFIRLDQLIYCLLILEICFHTAKMFVNDYGTILSRLKDDQAKLDLVANHDILTGLPNRYSCEKHFNRMFRQSPTEKDIRQLLIFIDIDNFKTINTRFGHNGGDAALEKVARSLQEIFPSDNAVVSRLGGDEFIIMLRIPNDQVDEKLNGALQQLAEPLTIFEQSHFITCSMGVIEVESTTSTFKEEYRKADMAMSRAKKTGKNRYCYYSQALNDITVQNIETGVKLFEALKKDEFLVFYQAQVDLESTKIIGAEALMRWKQPDGTLVSPADFIPIAEKNGSIVGMTHWILRQSCKDCDHWHANGFTDLFVSVNVPSTVLAEGSLVQVIKDICKETGFDANFLEIELTESLLLESGGYIQQQLQELRDMGVSLAIDDFGTGYSNLSYLSRLNVQKLKVDQSFVKNFFESYHDRKIIQAVTQIANSLGMKTVIEGIEKDQLVSPLRNLQCTIGQGFLWSKPVPQNEFLELLSQKSPYEDC